MRAELLEFAMAMPQKTLLMWPRRGIADLRERRLDVVEFLEISDTLKMDAHDILRQVEAIGRRR